MVSLRVVFANVSQSSFGHLPIRALEKSAGGKPEIIHEEG